MTKPRQRTKEVPLWAKLPIAWIQRNELEEFSNRGGWAYLPSRSERNKSIAALKLYVALCIRADFHTGTVVTTYDELITLTGMSRPIIANALKVLESRKRISRTAQSLRAGTTIYISGWLEDGFHGSLPKRWLFEGNQGQRLLRLQDFRFAEGSLEALKVFLVILAFRDKHRWGLTIISYDRIALAAGIGRHLVHDAITALYQMDLVSFRQVSFDDGDDMKNRTNRYLVRGLGIPWTALDQAYPDFSTDQSKKRKGPVSKAQLEATKKFVEKARTI